MSLPVQRRLLLSSFLLTLVFLLAGRAHAELVWTPQTGWKVEGGALADVASNDSTSAVAFMNKARAAEEKGSRLTAIKYYTRVIKRYPNSVYAPEAQYRLGNLRLERKQYLKAFEAYQIIATRYPNTNRYDEIVGKQYHIASLLLNGERGRVWGIFPGFTNREKAIGYMEVVLAEAPFSDYAPLALMCIASGHQYLRNNEEEIDALDRMINTYPQSVLAPEAYLKLAHAHAALVEGAYYDQTSTRDSITYYEDFMILFPGDNSVVNAEKGLTDMKLVLADSKIKIGDFYFYKRNNYKAARVFYNEAITIYPGSSVATTAQERLVLVDAAVKKAETHPKKQKRFFFF